MSSITVSSFQIPDWRWGGSTAKLRLYASKTFTDSLGVPHVAGTIGSRTGFYQEIALTVSGAIVTVPSFTTYSTTDARPGGDSTQITGVLFDSKGTKRETLFSRWRIPETPASTTWSTLETFNQSNPRINKPENVLSDIETAALINSIAGTLNDASDVIKGRTKLSVAPASASDPIAVGDNDPRLGSYINILTYGAVGDGTTSNTTVLTNAQAAAVSEGKGLYIPVGTFLTSSVTLTVPLLFAPGPSILKIAAGQTVSITGAFTADTAQHFSNADGEQTGMRSGHGKIDFANNKKVSEIITDWWGAKGDGTTESYYAVQGAANSMPSGARLKFVAGEYVTFWSGVLPKPNTVIDLNGTTLTDINFAFGLFPPTVATMFEQTKTLVSGGQGVKTLTLNSTTGLIAGRRIVIGFTNPAAAFGGGNDETGPLEFNTIVQVVNSTTITIESPTELDYTDTATWNVNGAFPGTPRVYLLWENYIHDVRMTNGRMKSVDVNASPVPIRMAERLEVDHVIFEDLGSAIVAGTGVSELYWHDNTSEGVGLNAPAGGTFANFAGLTHSRIIGNRMAFGNEIPNYISTGIPHHFNHWVCEVGCRSNLFQDNVSGPIRETPTAAFEFTYGGFANQFINNRICGIPADITDGAVTTKGIRVDGGPYGNVYAGNYFSNIKNAIIDYNVNSTFVNNYGQLDASSTTSIGITTQDANSTTIMGPNVWEGYHVPYGDVAGGIKGFAILSGAADPPAENSANPTGITGSIWFRKNGASGQTAWFKESVVTDSGLGNNGDLVWVPRNRFVEINTNHIIARGNTPTIAAGAGAGGSPTVTLGGTDATGVILVTAGAGATTDATVFTVTFKVAYPTGSGVRVILTPANDVAALLGSAGQPSVVYVPFNGTSETTFVAKSGTTALTNGASYRWFYQVTASL